MASDARQVSIPLLLGVVALMGAGLGTATYWITADREQERVDALLNQNTHAATTDRKKGMSIDLTAPSERALEGIPPYPKAVPRRVAEKMHAQGQRLEVAWFSTPDSVEQVLSFYEATFHARKQVYTSHRYSPRMGYVGWLQPDQSGYYADAGLEVLDGVMHLVTVMREAHETVVLISANRPLKLLGEGAGLPAGVVLPPWAEKPQVFDLGEGPLSQTTILSAVQGHGLVEVDRWLRDALAQKGWAIADQASGPSRTTLDFRRAQERLSVVLTPSGEKVALMVQYANQPLSLTEGLQ